MYGLYLQNLSQLIHMIQNQPSASAKFKVYWSSSPLNQIAVQHMMSENKIFASSCAEQQFGGCAELLI